MAGHPYRHRSIAKRWDEIPEYVKLDEKSPRRWRALEHRLVLWEKIGGGWHECFWCRRVVIWAQRKDAPSRKATGIRKRLCPQLLTVDHLDNDKHNNDPANLVPCCDRCNSARRDRVLSYTLRHDPDANWEALRIWAVDKQTFYCGHPFADPNIVRYNRKSGFRCRVCLNEYQSQYKAERIANGQPMPSQTAEAQRRRSQLRRQ